MKIDSFDTSKKVFIVAEIGNNHEGNLQTAQKMIQSAVSAGANAVKFQTIIPEKLVSEHQVKRKEQLKKLCLSYGDFKKLSEIAKSLGVIFLSTPFDLESARFLDPLVPAFKIASGDNDFSPLIDFVAETGKPLIISTGLSNYEEITALKNYVYKRWSEKGIKNTELALLHCTSSYPTVPEEANLLALRALAEMGVTIGYSDHTLGTQAASAAVALGARIIEKHFTLDKNTSSFRDHQLSLTPLEFTEMVQKIRETEVLMGDGIKKIQPGEIKIKSEARRSITAARPLKQGDALTLEDLDWVRPSGGLSPAETFKIVGKILVRDIAKGDSLCLEDVKKGKD